MGQVGAYTRTFLIIPPSRVLRIVAAAVHAVLWLGKVLIQGAVPDARAFSCEDHEAALDLLEVTLSNRHGRFTDDPRFQEGNEIAARFGYLDGLCQPFSIPQTASFDRFHSWFQVRIDAAAGLKMRSR